MRLDTQIERLISCIKQNKNVFIFQFSIKVRRKQLSFNYFVQLHFLYTTRKNYKSFSLPLTQFLFCWIEIGSRNFIIWFSKIVWLHEYYFLRLPTQQFKMFLLKNCLFFMKLETGGWLRYTVEVCYIHQANCIFFEGLIIGSIHLLLQVLLVLFSAAYLTIYDCSDFEKLAHLPDNRICMFHRGKTNLVKFRT